MFMDAGNTYSKNQAVTTTADSDGKLNQLAAGDAMNPLWVVVQVGTAFSGGTSLQINLVTDSSPTFGTAPVTYALTGVIPVASLTAGASLVKMKLPLGMKQHRKLVYTVAGTMGAGTITAFETPDVQTNRQN